MRFTLLGTLACLLLAGVGCQRPYQVFAVQVAHAPTVDAAVPPSVTAAAPDPPPTMPPRVRPPRREGWDLNRVPAATLRRLPGIAAVTVATIVAGRPYRAKRELLRRKILTPAQYARWKGYLVVHRTSRRRG